MSTISVRPADPGAVIPWPSLGRPLLSQGETVARDQFALRRLADGDVVEIIAEPAPVPAQTKKG